MRKKRDTEGKIKFKAKKNGKRKKSRLRKISNAETKEKTVTEKRNLKVKHEKGIEMIKKH